MRAEVSADLREVRGTIESDEVVDYVNALARLPEPQGDLERQRTFPGGPDPGRVSWTCASLQCTFVTTLPRRYGDIGVEVGKNLWANGAWYPVVEGAPVADWSVDIALPPGTTGVLNGQVSAGSLRFEGTSDRLALAVVGGSEALPGRVAVGNLGRATVLGRGARRPVVERQVAKIVGERRPFGEPVNLVVVATRHRQTLATAGPGVLYLSDRAFRLSPGLHPFHWAAVRRALYASIAPFSAAWDRAFAATAMSQGAPTPRVDRALGWAAWNPIVDALLTDGTLPFYDDIFDTAHPIVSDPMLAGRRDPRAAALQLEDIDPGLATAVTTRALATASTVASAARALGVDPALVDSWSLPEDPLQDYALAGRGGARQVRREGGVGAERVVVEVDGERSLLDLPPGGVATLPDAAKQVVVDPQAHLVDSDRSNNRLPARWSVVATGWVDDISPSQASFVAWANLVFRRRDDTHNLFLLGLDHDARDLVGASVGYLRHLGPPVNRRARQHRLYFAAGPTIFDPAYREVSGGQLAAEASVGYAWDTRVADTYATEGQRLAVGLGGGTLLDAEGRWASASATHVALLPLHPAHVVATRLKAGWASGAVEHRLLSLGGSDSLRAVGNGEGLGNERVLGNVEYRWAPLRDISAPLGVGWLAQVQLVPGLEAGASWRDPARTSDGVTTAAAAGATLGLYVVVDALGARPTLLGVSGAIPLWLRDVPDAGPQVYLSFDHAY